MTVYDASCHKQVSDWLKPKHALGNHSWKCIWICLLMFGEIAAILFKGDESIPRPTYLRTWLASTRLLYVARGRPWNSLDNTEHTPLSYVITLITPGICWPSYAIVMVAYVLASDRHQAISNHCTGVIMVILRVKGIMLHPLNKQCWREVERSATRQFLCYWRVRRLTTRMRYVLFINIKWKLGKCKIEGWYESLFTISNM